ncbi:MAG: mechanosensitive ion channel [SAR202 cluster bacterium]|nr:mechanosensitive ion channel [SAR202 cluster bacterium]
MLLRAPSLLMLGIVLFGAITLVIPLFQPSLGAYVSIVALASAFALQRYIASVAGYFVLRSARVFRAGDRIRIGTVKGDVRQIGMLHFIVDEVGEGENFGGELTGRIIHVPNHMVLDSPVLNYSQNFSSKGELLSCDYMFDEVDIHLTPGTPVTHAKALLERTLRVADERHLAMAKALYSRSIPNFMQEANLTPRVLVIMEPDRVRLVGKYVAPIRNRNELKSQIIMEFLEALEREAPAAAPRVPA